jgi:cysteinyl-tRNA synthetase
MKMRIAQSEATTGEPFVRYWVHNGFITVNEEKMSKSLGNFFLVRDILAKFPPETVRFFLLSTHYRSPLDFDDDKLAAAGRGLERIKTSIRLLSEALAKPVRENAKTLIAGSLINKDQAFEIRLDELKDLFEAAMDDDFNTALATGINFDLAREVNTAVQRLGETVSGADRAVLQKAMDLFKMFNEVLGIFKVDDRGVILLEGAAGDGSDLVEGLVRLIIEVRQESRTKKDWGTADRIRDGLKELGIVLEDTPQGVRWKKQG